MFFSFAAALATASETPKMALAPRTSKSNNWLSRINTTSSI